VLRPRLDRWASHPWMLGDPSTPGRKLGGRVRVMTIAAIVVANAVGATVVLTFALWALPKPQDTPDAAFWANLGLAVGYIAVALILGVVWGRRLVEGGRNGIRAWLYLDRPPTPKQQLRVLRGPLRIMAVQAVLWGFAVLCFTGLNMTFDPLLALAVGLTVAVGGLTTSSAAYLLCELALRPVAARALAIGAPQRRGVPGVAGRWLLAWALGTGAPVVGLALVGIVALTSAEISKGTLAITTVVLTAIALVFGALVSVLAAYATVHPIASIRRGLARVQEGDFDQVLAVWDSTEMGLLQAGFNDMVSGLRERERIRDLFGRQVGHDVARQALAIEGLQLGGEVADVTVLFVDIVGSTRLTATRPPQEVVELLNRFFAEVVDVVESHGGLINKFEGDAALAIFGAPVALADAAGSALRAARDLDARLRERVSELEAGIGVATGSGHIGAERRFEYTVIGDPVNEAARLTELAKAHPARVLASLTTVEQASTEEAGRWASGDQVTLRGRESATTLAHPAETTARA
jgi:adenylate cyclase